MSDPGGSADAKPARDDGASRDESEPQAHSWGRPPLTELFQVLVIYALTAIVVAVFAGQVLSKGPRMPGPSETVPTAIIACVPLVLAAMFVIRIRNLLIELRTRRFGARLKLRLVLLFLLTAALASIPQAIVLLRLAQGAQSQVAAAEIRDGLAQGLDLALGYYAEDARRLEYTARHDVPLLSAAGLSAGAERVLATLRDREPRMDAIEVFERGRSVAFAGSEAARLASPPAMAVAGPLAVSTSGDVMRLRYLQPWGDKGGSFVLTLRLDKAYGAAARALSRAKAQTGLFAPFSARWAGLLVLYYVLLALPLLLLAAILGFVAANLVLEPIVSLEAATRRVASGDLGLRLLVKPGDETGRLTASFNRMLAGIERYREGDRQRGKVSAWKDIAQRLAHELKNPLTPIRLSAERVLRLSKSDPARALELVEPSMLAIVSEVEGMDALLSDFRAFAALPAPVRDWTDLKTIVADSVGVYAASYPDVRFSHEGVPEGLALRVDRAQLKRAFANLLVNAVEAMEGRGRVEIGAELVKAADSRYCRIQVRDDGPGIAEDALERIFSPYFSTKERGTGLGLAIVERIVMDHGGNIRCESAPGAGASFFIDLPLDR